MENSISESVKMEKEQKLSIISEEIIKNYGFCNKE